MLDEKQEKSKWRIRQSVPVAIVARVYKKDPCWVRAGLIAGWLPIGFATRGGEKITSTSQIGHKKGRINYYISPKLLFEQTGFDYYKGDEHGD